MGYSCCHDDLPSLFAHALALQKKDDFEGARDHYRYIVAKYQQHTESHYNLAYILSQLQDYPQAIIHLKVVLKQQPRFAPAYFNLAINHLAQQQTSAAIEALGMALQYDPTHNNAQHLLGCLYLEQKDYAQALDLLETLNKRVPNNAEVLHNLGLAYLGLNQITQASKFFKTAVEQDPTLYEAHYNLGVIHASRQELDEAIAAYEKCIHIKPDYYAALFNLGRVYHDKRVLDKSRHYYQQALTLAPENLSIRYLIAAIDQSLTTPPEFAPPQYVMELFDSYALHYDQAMQQQLHYSTPKILRATIDDWLSHRNSKITLLDLGCGTGLAGQLFKGFTSQATGIDISAGMLIQAQQKNIYTQLETAEILSYLRSHFLQFDMIIAADVFLYFGDLSEVFKHIARLLEWRGVLGFSIESQTDKAEYKLQESARFAHHPDYIERLAKENKLNILVNQEAHLRRNHDVWIDGRIFWLEKLN